MKTTYPFVLVDIETNKYLTKNDSGNKLTGDFIKKTLNKKKRRGKSRELKKKRKMSPQQALSPCPHIRSCVVHHVTVVAPGI